MQRLKFHPAWERQMDPSMQVEIEEKFHQTLNERDMFVPLYHALNHQGDYLLTILIHNRTDESMDLSSFALTISDTKTLAEQEGFPTAEWSIEPHTSSPWTFIFSSQNHWVSDVEKIRISELQILPINR